MSLPNPQSSLQLHALELQQRSRGFFPTARQRQLLNDLTSAPNPGLALLGYGGAMGGGKTRAIVELALDAALAYPNNNVLVARQHYSDLSATTMREFFAACPPELIRRRQQSPTHLVELALPDWPAGQTSTVNFRHLSDWPSLGSQQYGAVLIDEAGQVDEDAALMLLTRLRDPAQPQRWFVAASNPWPGWFERWFVRRDLPEQALEQASGQVIFIPASIPDNPHLPPNYAELNHALLPNHWRDRFIEGRFDALLGRVYPEFDPQRHLWDAPLPAFTHYIGGLDFGGQTETAHHTAGIIAGLNTWPGQMPRAFPSPSLQREMPSAFPSPPLQREMPSAFPSPPLAGGDAAGRGGVSPSSQPILIRLAEFEDRGPGVTRRLEQWQRNCQRQFGRIRWCADRSQSAWIDHQRRQGIHVVPSSGGPGSVLFGISLVQDRLADDPPRSFYTPTMQHFPKRILEYLWNHNDADPEPKPRKRNDDLLDADRYMHELIQQSPRPLKTTFQIITPSRGRDARWRDP